MVGQFTKAIGWLSPAAACSVASSFIRAASQRSVGDACRVLAKYRPCTAGAAALRASERAVATGSSSAPMIQPASQGVTSAVQVPSARPGCGVRVSPPRTARSASRSSRWKAVVTARW